MIRQQTQPTPRPRLEEPVRSLVETLDEGLLRDLGQLGLRLDRPADEADRLADNDILATVGHNASMIVGGSAVPHRSFPDVQSQRVDELGGLRGCARGPVQREGELVVGREGPAVRFCERDFKLVSRRGFCLWGLDGRKRIFEY